MSSFPFPTSGPGPKGVPPGEPARPRGEARRLGTSLRALAEESYRLARDHVLLAVLEVQRAGLSLAKILAAGLVVAVLVVTAWMALVGATVIWAVGSGTPWPLALIAAAATNLVVALGLALWMRARLPELFLAATVRQLRGEEPGEEAA